MNARVETPRATLRGRLARWCGVGPVAGMTSPVLHVNPDHTRLDRVFFRRLLSLLAPYWWRREAWPAWLVYGSSIGLGLLNGLVGVWVVKAGGAQVNALAARAEPSYWQATTAMVGLTLLGYLVNSVLAINLKNFLVIHWNQWMTRRLLSTYLSGRTYYEIALDQEIDNPDQRIQNEVDRVVGGLSEIPSNVIVPIFVAATQIGAVLSISREMLWAALGYAAVETWVVICMMRPSVAFHWKATMAAADFRHNLVSLRENAETVAFYRGEAQEERSLVWRLAHSVRAQRVVMLYQIFTSVVNQVFSQIWHLMPLLIVAPLYFAGKIPMGGIIEATMGAGLVVTSFSAIKDAVPKFANLAPGIVRLAEIQEKLQRIERQHLDDSRSRIAFAVDERISFERVTVLTPDGQRSVVKDLSLEVPPHQPMLIVGQTGVGKSSLLRAMAGLWTRGEGLIRLPAPSTLMFLPQKPYMMLGSLRQQIQYPHHTGVDLSDAQLQACLEAVALPDLMARMGGADTVRDWRQVLSLGEQQRLAFARVLVARPRVVFLDESTSAVDVDTERRLYDLLANTVDNYISVGHRPTLLAYHEHVLRLRHDGWSLDPAALVAAQPAQAGFATQET